MKCYCYETETEFIFCIENADIRLEENILGAWWKKSGDKYIKAYPKEMDDGVSAYDKDLVKRNFSLLGNAMFEGIFEWEEVLFFLAQSFSQNGIEWYIIGSTCEAVLGADIKPHDIDIIVHTRDFYRVKNLFSDYIAEPFVDNKGAWLVRYFGRLCVGGAIVDIAADEKMNYENRSDLYVKTIWKGCELIIEPIHHRLEIEIGRGRTDRIAAIEKWKNS